MKLAVRNYGVILVVALFLGWLIVTVILYDKQETQVFESPGRFTVEEYLLPKDSIRFIRAAKPREFSFPEDFDAKPHYRTGWWYYTGNLQTDSGRRFGFQLTFFRHGLSPGEVCSSASEWRTNQIYMSHFAITDVNSQRFYNFQRFSRPVINLAGISLHPFEIWLENWSVSQSDSNDRFNIPEVKLYARENNIELDIKLNSTKSPVLQGENGYSRKGPEEGNASYYFSLTRLKAEGKIRLPNETVHVKGDAWMDREWSTSVLGKNQVGWDWFALQLSDTTEIMLYKIRERDGMYNLFSELTYIDKNGEKLRIGFDNVRLTVLDSWESPNGGIYPSGWSLKIPELKLQLTIEPLLKNQELTGYVRYWEGAVSVKGIKEGKEVAGHGYVELTGYTDGGISALQ